MVLEICFSDSKRVSFIFSSARIEFNLRTRYGSGATLTRMNHNYRFVALKILRMHGERFLDGGVNCYLRDALLPRVTLDSFFFSLLLSLEYSVIIIIYNNNDTRSRKRGNKKRERESARFALTRTRVTFVSTQNSAQSVSFARRKLNAGVPRVSKRNNVD